MKATLIPLAAPHPATGPVCDPPTCPSPVWPRRPRPPRPRRPPPRRPRRGLPQAPEHRPAPRVPRHRAPAHPDHGLDELRSRLVRDHRDRCRALRLRGPEDLLRLPPDPRRPRRASEVLDVGRTQRLVTTAIWKALVARDTHCRFPHCTRPPVICHAHHIVHWADGGDTTLDNLILLCGHHHRLIHAGPWTIDRSGPSTFGFHPPPASAVPAATHNATPDRSPPDG